MATKPQISKIFASLRELGWEREQLDQVVVQVSGGDSVRALSTEQAAKVIDVLVKAGASPSRKGKPRGRRTAANETLLITPDQRKMIEDLRAQIGGSWIRVAYFESACMRVIRRYQPATAGEGAKVIEMLKKRLQYEIRKASQ